MVSTGFIFPSRLVCGCAAVSLFSMLLLCGCGREVSADSSNGIIKTLAGGDTLVSGMAPTEAALLGITSIAIDPRDGGVYFSDGTRHIVGKVSADGSKLELIAGTQVAEFNGDGKPPLETSLHVPNQVAVHPKTGDLYVADTNNYRIRVIPADGSPVRTVAGSGVEGTPDGRLPTEVPFGAGLTFGHFTGDGGDATKAQLNMPVGVAIDASDVLIISDAGNMRIRAVNLGKARAVVAGVAVEPGRIMTIAGDGSFGSRGDNGKALSAQLAYPKALALDAQGNIYFVDSINKSVREIDRHTGIIKTVAVGGRATDDPLKLLAIEGVAVAGNGDIYYSDLNRHAVFRRAASSPIAHLVAGAGVPGNGEAEQDVVHSVISSPGAVAVNSKGELYFVEGGAGLLRKVVNEKIVTIAGSGVSQSPQPLEKGIFSVLAPITVADNGDVYTGDIVLHVVRRIRADNGIVETFAGTGKQISSGDGKPPDKADFIEPAPRYLGGTMYFVDPQGCLVRRVVNGVVERFAGTGRFGKGGEGGPATQADLSLPIGIGMHPKTKEIYITNLWLPRVLKVDNSGKATVVAGNGTQGFGGDGGPALQAQLNYPTAVAFKKDGTMFIADFANNRIRVVEVNGTINTYAGNGNRGFAGDGGPAKDAQLWSPNDLAVDASDNLYVTDMNNQRIRRIDAAEPHRITTIAGTGERGFSGDGGKATEAKLNIPRGLAFGPGGVLYFTDSLNRRVRMIRFN